MIMISWDSAIMPNCSSYFAHVYTDKRSAEKDWGDSIEGMKS